MEVGLIRELDAAVHALSSGDPPLLGKLAASGDVTEPTDRVANEPSFVSCGLPFEQREQLRVIRDRRPRRPVLVIPVPVATFRLAIPFSACLRIDDQLLAVLA
jgi:hypothetical protein